ncbi:MAG: DUF5989 family protein [Desulfobaccales bacterium]
MVFLRELWAFFKHHKKYILLPMVMMLLLMGLLVIFALGSASAPFHYTLF